MVIFTAACGDDAEETEDAGGDDSGDDNGEDPGNWPDERIWEELQKRMALDGSFSLNEGPIIEKTVAGAASGNTSRRASERSSATRTCATAGKRPAECAAKVTASLSPSASSIGPTGPLTRNDTWPRTSIPTTPACSTPTILIAPDCTSWRTLARTAVLA